jgi:hypothetical protein
MEKNSTILQLNWSEYFHIITSETRGQNSLIYKRRIAIITKARELFEKNKFCDMNKEERKFIAGMRNEISTKILQSLEPIEKEKIWGWFGSMEGALYFKHGIIENNKYLSLALDEIPLSGQVNKQHFLNFWNIFENIFKIKYIAPPTRLLCMKRPDYFVCLDRANKKNICNDFSIKKSGIDKHFYWDEIIERIFTCEWWKNPMPDQNNKEEIIVSSARTAFLDSLTYERTSRG